MTMKKATKKATKKAPTPPPAIDEVMSKVSAMFPGAKVIGFSKPAPAPEPAPAAVPCTCDRCISDALGTLHASSDTGISAYGTSYVEAQSDPGLPLPLTVVARDPQSIRRLREWIVAQAREEGDHDVAEVWGEGEGGNVLH